MVVELRPFKGLYVKDDPLEIPANAALSMLNMEVTAEGGIRTRLGLDDTTLAYTAKAGGSEHAAPGQLGTVTTTYAPTAVIAGRRAADNFLEFTYLPTGGGETKANNGAAIAQIYDFLIYGTLTFVKAYAATDAGIRGWDGTSGGGITSVAAEPRMMAIMPRSNRLVLGHFVASVDAPGGANGSPSTVFFSDPGVPETFTATNFIALDPGDGARITAMRSTSDRLIVFKDAAMFVFYAEGISATGQPIFNYRKINIPDPPLSQQLTVVGDDVVYYVALTGVYATNGTAPPVRISDNISGAFLPSTAGYVQYATSALQDEHQIGTGGGAERLYYAGGRLYFQYLSMSGLRHFYVYDTHLNEWLLWNFGKTTLASASKRIAGIFTWAPSLLGHNAITLVESGNGSVYRLDPTEAVQRDSNEDFSSFYESGYYDLGSGQTKRIREVIMDGQGNTNFSVRRNFESPGATTNINFGTDYRQPHTRRHWRKGIRANYLGFRIASASGSPGANTWSLRNLQYDVPGVRAVGVGDQNAA